MGQSCDFWVNGGLQDLCAQPACTYTLKVWVPRCTHNGGCTARKAEGVVPPPARLQGWWEYGSKEALISSEWPQGVEDSHLQESRGGAPERRPQGSGSSTGTHRAVGGGGAQGVRRFMEGTAMQRPVASESADLRSRQELERRIAGRTGLRRELAQTSEPRRFRAMSWEPWEGLKQELMDMPEKWWVLPGQQDRRGRNAPGPAPPTPALHCTLYSS